MSKIKREIDRLREDIARANRRMTEIESGLNIEYGEANYGLFGVHRLDVPLVDVIRSILHHLQLGIAHKQPPAITDATVIFESNKKKAPKRKIKKKK